jgi:hypothetical protein
VLLSSLDLDRVEPPDLEWIEATNDSGYYRSQPLLPGTYSTTVTINGFASASTKGLIVVPPGPLPANWENTPVAQLRAVFLHAFWGRRV